MTTASKVWISSSSPSWFVLISGFLVPSMITVQTLPGKVRALTCVRVTMLVVPACCAALTWAGVWLGSKMVRGLLAELVTMLQFPWLICSRVRSGSWPERVQEPVSHNVTLSASDGNSVLFEYAYPRGQLALVGVHEIGDERSLD